MANTEPHNARGVCVKGVDETAGRMSSMRYVILKVTKRKRRKNGEYNVTGHKQKGDVFVSRSNYLCNIHESLPSPGEICAKCIYNC